MNDSSTEPKKIKGKVKSIGLSGFGPNSGELTLVIGPPGKEQNVYAGILDQDHHADGNKHGCTLIIYPRRPQGSHARFTHLWYSASIYMTTAYTLQWLALRKQPFSFTEGLASAFEWTPISQKYNVSPTPNAADARAIASDFIVTGNDMRAALADYARAH
jgi:hypothetical protein